MNLTDLKGAELLHSKRYGPDLFETFTIKPEDLDSQNMMKADSRIINYQMIIKNGNKIISLAPVEILMEATKC